MKNRTKAAEENQRSAAWDMLYLTACAILMQTPDKDRVAAMDFQQVYAYSRGQSLDALTYSALERLPLEQLPGLHQVLKQWRASRDKAIRKTILMDGAHAQLFAFLESQQIWHLPLKGVILSPLYPLFGSRQMADHDILFDVAHRQTVRDYFVSQGYTIESYGKSNHDAYLKAPVYNFEMHVALFHEDSYPQLASYYREIQARLLPVACKAFEYKMTDEDFYLYFLAHAYKHCSNCGTGLRTLVDLYIYLQAKPDLNRAYLDAELQKLGISEFEVQMRALAQKAFAPNLDRNTLTDAEAKLLQEMLFSRTYGTIEQHWKNQVLKSQPTGTEISSGVKLRYLWGRLFPSKAHMEVWCELYAPFFLRHPHLLPASRLWRLLRADHAKRQIVQKEFQTVRKM